jgi:hypothetical protein
MVAARDLQMRYTLLFVRQVIAILMTAIFSFILIVPLFASDEDSSVPLCCRRDGRHHCSMNAGETGAKSAPVIAERCPYSPTAKFVVNATPKFHAAGSVQTEVFVFSHSKGKPQTEARGRVSFSRTLQKRGPPTIGLS